MEVVKNLKVSDKAKIRPKTLQLSLYTVAVQVFVYINMVLIMIKLRSQIFSKALSWLPQLMGGEIWALFRHLRSLNNNHFFIDPSLMLLQHQKYI